jgi:hypothetical protein
VTAATGHMLKAAPTDYVWLSKDQHRESTCRHLRAMNLVVDDAGQCGLIHALPGRNRDKAIGYRITSVI